MSTDHARLRQSVYHEVGCDVEDLAESARKQAAEHRGAKQALRRSAQSMKTITAAIDADLEGGVFAAYGDNAQDVAKYAKLQVERCKNSLENAARHEENCEVSALGGLNAADKMLERIKKKHDVQKGKIEKLERAIADGDVISIDGDLVARDGLPNRDRPSGVRPGKSVAAQRKTEATEEKPKRKRRKKKDADGTDAGQNAGA